VGFFYINQAGKGSRPRLECSPPLAFGLGTASQNFSAEKFCSGVRLLIKLSE